MRFGLGVVRPHTRCRLDHSLQRTLERGSFGLGELLHHLRQRGCRIVVENRAGIVGYFEMLGASGRLRLGFRSRFLEISVRTVRLTGPLAKP